MIKVNHRFVFFFFLSEQKRNKEITNCSLSQISLRELIVTDSVKVPLSPLIAVTLLKGHNYQEQWFAQIWSHDPSYWWLINSLVQLLFSPPWSRQVSFFFFFWRNWCFLLKEPRCNDFLSLWGKEKWPSWYRLCYISVFNSSAVVLVTVPPTCSAQLCCSCVSHTHCLIRDNFESFWLDYF